MELGKLTWKRMSRVTHIARGPVCGIPVGFVMMSVQQL